jgi:hypothetical protein
MELALRPGSGDQFNASVARAAFGAGDIGLSHIREIPRKAASSARLIGIVLFCADASTIGCSDYWLGRRSVRRASSALMAEKKSLRTLEDLLRVVRALAHEFKTDTVFIVGS